MKFVFTIILLSLITKEIAYSCQDDCCVTQECQTCCQSHGNCCQANSNCCQTNSNCCQTNSNCCQTSSNCCRTNKNCKSSDDCCKTAECKTQPPTKMTETTIRPDETAPVPEPEIIIGRRESIMNNSNSNRPNITFTLNMNNNFTNVNHINNPVSINNDNQQQISVFFSMKSVNEIAAAATTTTSTTTGSSSTTPSSKENSTGSTEPCNPIPILVPMPQEAPKPAWNTLLGCCMVVSPCLHGLDECTPYKRVCGMQCTHTYMYQPFNPCDRGGCYKRSFGTWNHCNYVGCRTRVVDCNYCQDDFYASYQGYNQCGGCYYL